MAFRKFIAMAFRNLLRNGRRTALTALAVGLGLVVVMAMSGMIEGMVTTMLADGIRISSGHLQIRSASYDPNKGSLLARDLLSDGEALAAELESLPEVVSAAPVLWAGGLLSTPRESIGVQIVGIDPEDRFHDPIRQGIAAGQYLSGDDRRAILVGRGLADQMGIAVGQRVSLASSGAGGEGQEGIFTVAGLVDTGFPSIDQNRVLMTLEQAQGFTGVGNRVSTLIVMLQDQETAGEMAAALARPELEIETWRELNSLILESVENGLIFYYILYGIVFVAVAVLIANTLLMSVFGRMREIGILGSLGMNRSQILTLFLIEGVLLAIFGVILGFILGLGVVAYMTYVGISIPAETAALVEGFPMGTTLYSGFAPGQFVVLSLILLVVVALVSLYPAWFAARMEPVAAIHEF